MSDVITHDEAKDILIARAIKSFSLAAYWMRARIDNDASLFAIQEVSKGFESLASEYSEIEKSTQHLTETHREMITLYHLVMGYFNGPDHGKIYDQYRAEAVINQMNKVGKLLYGDSQ